MNRPVATLSRKLNLAGAGRLLKTRWDSSFGRIADTCLLASSGIAFVALLFSVLLTKFGLHRGVILLAVGFFTSVVIALPGYFFARVSRRRIFRSRGWCEHGLLDGLWLPRSVRLVSWTAVFGCALLHVGFSLRWAPQSEKDRQITELGRTAESADNQLRQTKASDKTVELRGKLGLRSDAARELAAALKKGKRPSFLSIPLPNSSRKPSSDAAFTSDSGGHDEWPDEPGTPLAWTPPDPEVPVTTDTQTNYEVVARKARDEENFLLGDFLLPIKVVFELAGWGSRTEYREQVLKSIARVSKGNVIAKNELLAMLEDVPRDGLSHWQQRYEQVIDLAAKKKPKALLTETQVHQFKQNVSEAVSEARLKKKKQHSHAIQQLVKAISFDVKAKKTTDVVVRRAKGLLPEGQFPGEEFRNDLKVELESKLEKKGFNDIWSALERELRYQSY